MRDFRTVLQLQRFVPNSAIFGHVIIQHDSGNHSPYNPVLECFLEGSEVEFMFESLLVKRNIIRVSELSYLWYSISA